MARPKGSLNKKNLNVQYEFDGLPESDEQTEVCMTVEAAEELETIQKEIDQARVELEKTRMEIDAKKQELKTIPVNPIQSPAIAVKDTSAAEKIAAQKKIDSEMVTGKFSNLRVPGQSVKLPYQKYGDEPVKWHEFDHGKVYTIQRGFADQINGGTDENPCYYMPRFIKNEGVILDPNQPESGIHSVDTSNKRYMFSPIAF